MTEILEILTLNLNDVAKDEVSAWLEQNVSKNVELSTWITNMIELTNPDEVVLFDGSQKQIDLLREEACKDGDLIKLNPDKFPGCYLHNTNANDVARVERRNYICSKDDPGPTNNWMKPDEAYAKLTPLFKNSMKGRTMYIVPFMMGMPGSSFSKLGVELTDSIYVVLNMAIMTRAGRIALDAIDQNGSFTKCLHARKDINEEERYTVHFPEDNTIWSINSGYGGNVLLGKKCLALRIASYVGKQEGWLAEHMLILGLENPQGEVKYIAAAFPSACGKTNLAMLIPPSALKGYKVWTVGDDIAWIRVGEDGRLWAINPEAGFFGVAPGTSHSTNPNAMDTVEKNTIFTNVLLKEDNTVWWEGMDGDVPQKGKDWLKRDWTPDSGERGAQANSRFTAPANQCPCISPEWENPNGVPISSIIFGGRRAKTAPLVYQTFDWNHGVFAGATMASETTAATSGAVGVVRHDPMAMLPFCGYNMADYFGHWINIAKKLSNPPKIFHVNWFRINASGKYMWPGFGDNLRVLNWIIDRCEGKVGANKTPIGYVPDSGDLNLEGLDIDRGVIDELLRVDKEIWLEDIKSQREFFAQFGNKLPKEINEQLELLQKRLQES